MSNIDQEIAEALDRSTSQAEVNWENCLKAMEEKNYNDPDYREASKAIVEPRLSEEAFDVWENWLEDKIQAWCGFIKTNTEYEPNWYKVAQFVAENGY